MAKYRLELNNVTNLAPDNTKYSAVRVVIASLPDTVTILVLVKSMKI